MDVLFDIHVIVLVLGGILALSALIVAQKPNAKQTIDKLVPYQATIGVALVALGIVNGLRLLPKISDAFKTNLLLAAVQLSVIGVSILLGALFGMGLITKLIPGNSNAEHKAYELAQKIAPYQILLGLIGLAAAALYFLYRFHILTMHA
jgi:hypothetical protein